MFDHIFKGLMVLTVVVCSFESRGEGRKGIERGGGRKEGEIER